MVFDRAFTIHCHGDHHCENPKHNGKLGALTLCIHSFIDGLAIGLAFKVSPTVGWTVTAAVLAHDFSDGINTVNMILKNNGKQKEAILWLILDALAPAIGVVLALFINIADPILGLILAVFAGLFFYIGASDLIPESHHQHPTVYTTIITILGIVTMYFIINLVK
jgi:ZIP family zinc transporter